MNGIALAVGQPENARPLALPPAGQPCWRFRCSVFGVQGGGEKGGMLSFRAHGLMVLSWLTHTNQEP
jgi:hypothetical protein